MDLQQTRPNAHWSDDGDRVIDWPEITFVAGTARARRRAGVRARSRRCAGRRVSAAIVDVARTLGVRDACTLGGMPSLVSHRRPRAGPRDGDPSLARAGDRAAAARPTADRPDCRRSCSARSATPASAARVSGPRCRSTSRARRRRRRSARCSRRLAEVGPPRARPAPARRALRRVRGAGSTPASRPGPTCRRSSTASTSEQGATADDLVVRDRAVPAAAARRDSPAARAGARLGDRRTAAARMRPCLLSGSMRSPSRPSGPTSWSSASRTGPARSPRWRASRRSSSCARPTARTCSSCTRAGAPTRTSSAG